MKLIMKGKASYIKRMYKHLRAEHPSTKKRMTIKPESSHYVFGEDVSLDQLRTDVNISRILKRRK